MKTKEQMQAKMKMEAAISFLRKGQRLLQASASDLEQVETFDLDLEEVRLALDCMVESLTVSVKRL